MIEKGTARQNDSTLEMERNILHILKQIDKANNTKKQQANIQSLVEVLGKYGKADRAYIFETIHGSKIFTNTYEWCAQGVTPQIDNLQDVKSDDMPVWYDTFKRGDSVIINDIENIIDTMPLEYNLLKLQSIKSVIALPLFHGSYLIGFLGLDNPDIQESEIFVFLLELVGAHIGSAGVSSIIEERLEKQTKEMERKNMVIDVLCQEYTSAFYIDLNSGMGEILKIDVGANAAHVMSKEEERYLRYVPMMKAYANRYVLEEDRDYFMARLEPRILKEALLREDRVSFRYQSIPNGWNHGHFEVQIVRVEESQYGEFGALVAFRYIDDIIKQEIEARKVIEEALEESRMSNSILSTLGKLYFSVYQIDLEKNECEEIVADEENHRLTGNVVCATEKLKGICTQFVDSEYYDTAVEFFNLTTLADRLHGDTIALEYKAKDNNWHLARFIVKRRNERGEAVEVLYVTHLISDTKRKEEKLTSIAERAQRENDAKTEFLSRISHDIRTPMNAVCGFTKIARENIDNTEKVCHALRQIDVASGYLQQIVNDVLDLNRIEMGGFSISMDEMSVSQVFQYFIDSIQNVMPEKKLNVSSRMENIMHDRVLLDELRLKQIYANLISNAFKYTPNGGSIEIVVSQEESEKENHVCLVTIVRDTGIGMTQAYMKKNV